MDDEFEVESFRDWVEMNKDGRPTKKQIEAFDDKHGPTRRSQLKEMLTRGRQRQRVWSR